MIKNKTIYKVPDNSNKLFDEIIGVWCTDNKECKNMDFEEARKHSKCISGRIIDKSIKDCLIFTFLDAVNHGLKKDKFIEIKYEELIVECDTIEIVICE